MATGINCKKIFDHEKKKTNLISNVDLIKAELEMLFSIDKYKLFFSNNFGLDFSKYVFLKNKTAVFNLIKYDIEETLKKYGKVVPVKIEMMFLEVESKLVINLNVIQKGGGSVISLPLSINI